MWLEAGLELGVGAQPNRARTNCEHVVRQPRLAIDWFVLVEQVLRKQRQRQRAQVHCDVSAHYKILMALKVRRGRVEAIVAGSGPAPVHSEARRQPSDASRVGSTQDRRPTRDVL